MLELALGFVLQPKPSCKVTAAVKRDEVVIELSYLCARCRVIFGQQRSKPRALLQPTLVSGQQQAHSWGQLFLWRWWSGTSIYSQVLMLCGYLKLLLKSQF